MYVATKAPDSSFSAIDKAIPGVRQFSRKNLRCQTEPFRINLMEGCQGGGAR